MLGAAPTALQPPPLPMPPQQKQEEVGEEEACVRQTSAISEALGNKAWQPSQMNETLPVRHRQPMGSYGRHHPTGR
jgi:hypothetical protein